MQGLTTAQVEQSRRQHGSNVITPPPPKSPWGLLLEKFHDPLIVILMVAGILSVGISCYEYFLLHTGPSVFFEPVGIFVAILLATVLAFVFEYKAEKEFTLLSEVNDDEAAEVIRNSSHTRVPRRDIVVGDIVVLHTGDEISADGRLLSATSLSVDESSLTGEQLCHKTTDPALFDKDATFPSDCVYRGTRIMEGHAVMKVTAVGDHTEAGKVYRDVSIDASVKTPLHEQLDRLGTLISRCSYLVAAGVVVGRLAYHFAWHWASWTLALPVVGFFLLVIYMFPRWNKRNCLLSSLAFALLFAAWFAAVFAIATPGDDVALMLAYVLQTVMVAVTLIVVAVPEGLPMAITLSLAYSMRRMFKTNNLVRTLHACETMGATTVICTDKTGTLTQNRMQVAETLFFGDTTEQDLADAVALCSTASLDFSNPSQPKPVGNPTESALLLAFARDVDSRRLSADILEEVPFSTERKYMAVKVRFKDAVKPCRVFLKGAPEIVLALTRPLAPDMEQKCTDTLASWQGHAMRTLAIAWTDCPEQTPLAEFIADRQLVMRAVVAIADPIRAEVPDAIAECLGAGIDVKIVTGDTEATAREIARQIGMDTANDADFVTGTRFAEMSDAEVAALIPHLKVMSRARPGDKRRLVEALNRAGSVVAVTGDGTNDAPALKAAHVGLSMGDGTAVAKHASDITILDNSFSSITSAVMWGRSLYRNIQRFLLFQLTVNVAACLLVLIGSFLGERSPLTVTQMLWVNLIMDTFGAMALSSLPPSRAVLRDKPRDRRASIITRDMAANIFGVGILFFAITFVFMWIFLHADITSLADLLRLPDLLHPAEREMSDYEATLLFSIFVWTHFWYMFCTRGFKSGESALNLRGCQGFLFIAALIVVGQVLIVEVAGAFFNVVPLSLADWLIIVASSSLVLWLRELHAALSPPRR